MFSFHAYPANSSSFQRYNKLVNATPLSHLQLLRLLASRLERLSVDSHWARRASGLRGNIVKVLEEAASGKEVSPQRLDLLTDAAFDILRRAAQAIPDLEDLRKKI
jgi:hypothetical protein